MLDMTNHAATTHRNSMVAEMTSRLIDLLAKPVVSAFASGDLLRRLRQEKHLYEEAGFGSFEDVIQYVGEKAGRKRSALYENMNIAERFDVHAHGHLGIAKLRLLVKGDRRQALELIEEGIEVPRIDGGLARRPIKEMTYRELRDYLKEHPLDPDEEDQEVAILELKESVAQLGLEPGSVPTERMVS